MRKNGFLIKMLVVELVETPAHLCHAIGISTSSTTDSCKIAAQFEAIFRKKTVPYFYEKAINEKRHFCKIGEKFYLCEKITRE